MTREKALKVSNLLYKIETYEALLCEISRLEILEEIHNGYGEDLEEELLAVIQQKLDKLLKELKEM